MAGEMVQQESASTRHTSLTTKFIVVALWVWASVLVGALYLSESTNLASGSLLTMPSAETVHVVTFAAFMVILWVDFLALMESQEVWKTTMFRLVLLINALPCTTYLLVMAQVAPVVTDQFGLEDMPMRYMQWCISTPALLLLVHMLARSSGSWAQLAAVCFIDVVMIVFGWVATWAPMWEIWFALSGAAFLVVMWWQWATLGTAIREAVHPRDVLILYRVRIMTMVIWAMFPAAWVLRVLHYVEPSTAEIVVCFCDLSAKLVHSSALRTSGFMRLDRFDVAQTLANENVITDTGATRERLGQMTRLVNAAAANAQGTLKLAALGTLSHELRTPLNAIVGYNSMLLDSPIDSGQKKSVYLSLQAARRLEAVITNIVTFSDYQRNGMPVPVLCQFNLEAEVDSVLVELADRGVEKRARISVHIDDGCPVRVTGPRQHYHMVLHNLIDNAINAIAPTGGTVTVRISRRVEPLRILADNSQRILVSTSITDSGVGVPESIRERIFQPYVRATDSGANAPGGAASSSSSRSSAAPAASSASGMGSKSLADGIGLGLTVSRALCHANRGSVDLLSTLGGKSTFTARFPVTVSADSLRAHALLARPTVLGSTMAAHATLCLSLADIASHVSDTLRALGVTVRRQPPDALLRELAASRRGISSWGQEAVVTSYLDLGATPALVRVQLTDAQLPMLVLATPFQRAMLSATPTDASSTAGSDFSQFPPTVVFLTYPYTPRRVFKAMLSLSKRMTSGGKPHSAVTSMSESDGASDAEVVDLTWLRVLVVDDVKSNRMVLTRMLKKLGITCAHQAVDGQQAIDMAARGHYDVILMDILMPNVDGIEATRRIRQQPPRPRPAIISITASDSVEQSARATAAGVDDQLLKPIRRVTIVPMLERVVQSGLASRTSQPRPQRTRGGIMRDNPTPASHVKLSGDTGAAVSTRRRRRRARRDKPLRTAHAVPGESQVVGDNRPASGAGAGAGAGGR